MVSHKQMLVGAILLLSCYVQSGTSIECYVCESGCEEYDNTAKVCEDPVITTTLKPTTTLEPDEVIPREDSQKSKAATIADWMCYLEKESGDSWKRGCTKVTEYCGSRADCAVCSEDLCNSASQLASTLFVSTAILMIVKQFY